jgi:aspartate aminotransferase
LPQISRRAALAPPSPIRRLMPLAEAARQRGIHVHHLNIGQPDLPTPAPMRAALARYRDEVIAYGPSDGLPVCRAALRRYYDGLGIPVGDSELVVTTAGSEALLFALAACTNPGESVVVPEPLYANYLGFATLLGVEVRPIPCTVEDGYHLPDQLDRWVEPGTRAFLFANPGNPTGTVYSREELARVADLARRRSLFVIADEVYREFVYDSHPRATSLLEFADVGDRAIVADSMSKRYSLCGARVGALISRNAEVMAAVRRFAMARLSPPVLGQLVAAAAVELGPGYFEEIRALYRGRRDLTVRALRAIPGVVCPEPEGAFYVMARLPVADAEAFVRFLLESFAIDGETTMLAPGNGFYHTPGSGQDEVRVAYVLEEGKLKRALRIVAEGLAAYAQVAEPATSPSAREPASRPPLHSQRAGG